MLDLVQAIADAGAPVVANRVAALLSKMFAFALDTIHDAQRKPLLEASPATRIPRQPETPRDHVLTDAELCTLWASFDALDPAMAAFYKLRLLTAQRGGEVASMRWQDLDLLADVVQIEEDLETQLQRHGPHPELEDLRQRNHKVRATVLAQVRALRAARVETKH